MSLDDILCIIRGGGDLATGVAVRLHRSGFAVLVTELPQPLAVRRAAAFAEAVYTGRVTVEGITAVLAEDAMIGLGVSLVGEIPVVVDPEGRSIRDLRPQVLIDARLAKVNLGTSIDAAPLVVGLGPGFTAGLDCHAVVETNRGHNLGRVIWEGVAEPDTRAPEAVSGFGVERVLRAPGTGTLRSVKGIGDPVAEGDLIATVGGAELRAPFAGVLRGLVHDGLVVEAGLKVGDLDPRGLRELCFTVSDKARAIGGGVLEAILAFPATRALLTEEVNED